MDLGSVREALNGEARSLHNGVTSLSAAQWELPTRCAPWSVRELLGHVRVALAWLPDMLAAPRPAAAEVTAAGYYRPDARFDPRTNATRIELAQRYAAGPTPVAAGFRATAELVDSLCRGEPEDRVVRTRHGDAMLLSQFLITRVVEVTVHGLDLADALGCDPWLTAPAGDVVLELLLGPDWLASTRELGWDRPDVLRRATGRAPLGPGQAARVERLGITWLTLG